MRKFDYLTAACLTLTLVGSAMAGGPVECRGNTNNPSNPGAGFCIDKVLGQLCVKEKVAGTCQNALVGGANYCVCDTDRPIANQIVPFKEPNPFVTTATGLNSKTALQTESVPKSTTSVVAKTPAELLGSTPTVRTGSVTKTTISKSKSNGR
jgi:hypothetical protein